MAPRFAAYAIATAAAWLLSPEVVRACSWAVEHVEYAIDPSARTADAVPPSPFTEVRSVVSRRKGTHCEDGQCFDNSCGDQASVTIEFVAPHDDRTARGELGYRIEWIDGEMPRSMQAMLGRYWPLTPRLSFAIGFEEAAEIDATIALIAVDRAGNESVPSAPVALVFSGCTKHPVGERCVADASGCAASGGRSGSTDAFAILAALLVLRRRVLGPAR
jgi:hypothetical protein